MKYKFKDHAIKEVLHGTFQGALYKQQQGAIQEALKGPLQEAIHK